MFSFPGRMVAGVDMYNLHQAWDKTQENSSYVNKGRKKTSSFSFPLLHSLYQSFFRVIFITPELKAGRGPQTRPKPDLPSVSISPSVPRLTP